MPLPSAVAAYYAVCRHLRVIPNTSTLSALTCLPPRPSTFCAREATSDAHAVALCSALLVAHTVPWRHVSNFVTTFAPECGPTDLSSTALTILPNIPPSVSDLIASTGIPNNNHVNISSPVLPSPPSSSQQYIATLPSTASSFDSMLSSSSSTGVQSTVKTTAQLVASSPTGSLDNNILVVDFSDSYAITPRAAAAILAACLIIPHNGQRLQLELHLRHCLGVHKLDLQPWHSFLEDVNPNHSISNSLLNSIPSTNSSDYDVNSHCTTYTRLTGLALDGCPLRSLPAGTLRKLIHLRWISMRATRLRNFWRIAEIMGTLPSLVAALFAGDATCVNDLRHLERVGRLPQPRPTNAASQIALSKVARLMNPHAHQSSMLDVQSHSTTSDNDHEHEEDFDRDDLNPSSSNVGDDVHKWMSHGLRMIPGFSFSYAFHHHTPATRLFHFRDFALAARPLKKPLLWLDDREVSACERQRAREIISSKFERAPCSQRLPRTSRIFSLLQDRELGILPHSTSSRTSSRARGRPILRGSGNSTMLMDLSRPLNGGENIHLTTANERISSGRPKKRIRNVNLTQAQGDSMTSMNGIGRNQYVPRAPDLGTVMAAAGHVRAGGTTPAQDLAVALAAVAAAEGGVPPQIEQLMAPLISSQSQSGGSPSSSMGFLKRKKQAGRQKRQPEQKRDGSFEHLMDKALVRRRGCARVSYWRQGNERPRQFEYNPGKAGEVVYATANGMLVVADEESGDVTASCRVGGGPGWRRGRGGYVSGMNSAGPDRIAKTYDLDEAIRHNAGGGLGGAQEALVGEGQTSVFGIAWLNKRSDMFVCGDHSGLIHMYNVGWMQDQRSGGCVHAFERFDKLTSISVAADDRRFAVSGSGHSNDVGLFDVGTGRCIETMSGIHASTINVIKFAHNDPNVLLTSSFEGCVRKWDLRERRADGSRRAIFTARTSNETMMACFSPDDQWLLVSAVDNEVRQYSAVDGRPALQFDIARTGNRYNYTRSYYMNDGDYIVSGSCMESILRVYNARGSGALLTEVDLDERGDVNLFHQHQDQPNGFGFDIGVDMNMSGPHHHASKSPLRVQSLRASPWRSFNVCALLVTTDQSVDELIAQDVNARRSHFTMALQSLFVVNKAGSLIFYRRLSDAAPQLSQNDYLHLASTFHGCARSMQLLVQELSPERSAFGYGIVTLVTSTYTLQAFRAASGVQFFVTADPQTDNLGPFLREVYVLYADYVMKNPFYELDMPIKVDKWDWHLKQVADRYNLRHATSRLTLS